MSMKKRIKIVVIILVIAIIVGIIGIFLLKNKENKNIEYTIDEVQQYSYYVVRENNKYGVIGRNGEKVIEADYDNVKIPNPEKDVFICYKDGKSMVLNSNAETILGEFQQVEPIRLKNVVSDLMYEKSVLIYEKDGKYGLVDFGGKKITENIYEEIDTLSSQEGKLIEKKDEKVGIININGYEIIKCNYDKIDIDGYYQEDGGYKYAGYIISNTTEEGYRYGYVNYKGEMIVEPECNQLSRVIDIEDKENAYLILAKNGQYGVFKNDKEPP